MIKHGRTVLWTPSSAASHSTRLWRKPESAPASSFICVSCWLSSDIWSYQVPSAARRNERLLPLNCISILRGGEKLRVQVDAAVWLHLPLASSHAASSASLSASFWGHSCKKRCGTNSLLLPRVFRLIISVTPGDGVWVAAVSSPGTGGGGHYA